MILENVSQITDIMPDEETVEAIMQVGKPTEEDIGRVEKTFIGLCKNNSIKWGSERYFLYQMTYFSGAMIMCNYSVPSWSISLMGRREIISKERYNG